jgi:hypothetical protein
MAGNVLNFTDLDGTTLLHISLRPGLVSDKRTKQEDLLAVLKSETSLHLGAGHAGGFYHNSPLAKTGSDNIATAERVSARRPCGPELGDESTMAGDRLGKVAVLPRVADGDTSPENGDGSPTGIDRRPVCGGVNPSRKARDNSDISFRQQLRHTPGAADALVRSVASPHDSNRANIALQDGASHKEERRKIRDEAKVRRVVLVKNSDEDGTDLLGGSKLGIYPLEQICWLTDTTAKNLLGRLSGGRALLDLPLPQGIKPAREESLASDEAPIDTLVAEPNGAES